MNFLKNVKIGGKMILGFGLVVVLAIALAVLSVVQLSNVGREYEYLLDGPVARGLESLRAQSEIRGLRRTVTASVMHAPNANIAALDALQTEALNMYDIANRAIDEYENTVRMQRDTNDQEWYRYRIDLVNAVRTSLSEYMGIFHQVQQFARLGDHAGALEVTVSNAHIVEALISTTSRMVALTPSALASGRTSASDSMQTANTIIILITIIVFVTAIIIAVLVSRSIAKPVGELVTLTKQISAGEVNMNLDRSKVTNNEIGILTGDLYNMVDTIRNMVDDIQKFSYEIDTNGDIEYRIDASKYRGSYNDMITSLNGFTDNFVGDVISVLNVLSNVNKGVFEADLKKLPGKKAALTENCQALITSLNAVTNEVGVMIDAAANKGDMSFRIDSSKYEGGWASIMEGLNEIAKAVYMPLKAIEIGLKELELGNCDLESINSRITAGGYDPDPSAYNGIFRGTIHSFDQTAIVIASYIKEIDEFLALISQGDLTRSITRDYAGDFSAIKDSINNISKTLHSTMSEITAAAEQVMSGAEQISTSAQDLAVGAQEQASSVEELNASIEVVSEQTRQNAENAGQANLLSGKSADSAQEGNDAMTQMLVAMQSIKESSDNITGIIKTIEDIAFQTNLLALNASVEAARAGEHGRGFAVVAEEVRTLAGRSQTAAAETTGLIGESIQRTESGAAIAETTSESLHAIVDSVNNVLSIINQIAISSQEQSESVQHISDGLAQISKVVQSNSAVSEETAAASQELSSQAQLLQQLVAYFRV